MKFKMPVAKRERLEELLEYLGKTENYSKYYKGNRAEDFRKCFDTESEWCWKYADIVLRGLEKRTVGPGGEGHHGVPRSFYGVKRNCHRIDDGNWFTLSYVEHVWAHYCACYCATGKMQGKMARAFLIMYSIGICEKRPLMPSEVELLASIPEMELRRIRAMEPRWAKVEAEGRTHHSEDPKQHKKDYYEANKDKITERNKAYYEANKDKITERNKAYREANREKIAEQNKVYQEKNKEHYCEYHKAYREANREKIAERNKTYRKANKKKITERNKAYWEVNKEKCHKKHKLWCEANKEKLTEYHKVYYEANREKLIEYQKDLYEANKDKIIEQHKAYREANKEKIAEREKARYEANKEKILEQHKAYREANKEKITEREKARYEAKIAAGYRRRKNPNTGKHEWVFMGLPEAKEVA